MPDPDLRVLVVTSALVPDQLQTWGCAAEVDGIDLHVAGAMVHDASESYLAPLGTPTWGTTHELAAKGWLGRGRLWWNLDGLVDLIGRLRPDVVHVHSEAWGRLVDQALGGTAPVVAHGAENVSLTHGSKVEAALRVRMAQRNARRLAGYASWNQEGIDILRRNGLAPGAPTAVAPAIVPDPAPYLATEHVPSDGPVRVGYVGRLVPEKGVQWLIEALDGVDDARLVVVGSGPYESELRRVAARRGVAVEFRGVVDGSDMPAVLAGLDIVVVPSLVRPGWAEQFGRVVCEAMLVGVPLIASDSGSLAAVVGDGGITVPELDHDALRHALTSLIADPDVRAKQGEAGRAWAVEQLGPDTAARHLIDLWAAVAGRADPSPRSDSDAAG
jgi:glycosyltransferase involved in cell wall biosynthesis